MAPVGAVIPASLVEATSRPPAPAPPMTRGSALSDRDAAAAAEGRLQLRHVALPGIGVVVTSIGVDAGFSPAVMGEHDPRAAVARRFDRPRHERHRPVFALPGPRVSEASAPVEHPNLAPGSGSVAEIDAIWG